MKVITVHEAQISGGIRRTAVRLPESNGSPPSAPSSTPPLSVWEVRHAKLFGYGLVSTSDNRLVCFEDRFQTREKITRPSHQNAFTKPELLFEQGIPDSAFQVVTTIKQPGYNVYGHLLIDILPSLFLIKHVLGYLPGIICPSDFRPDFADLIQEVFPGARLCPVPTAPGHIIHADKLIIASHLRELNDFSFFPEFRSFCRFLRSSIGVDRVGGHSHGRVFLSRSRYPDTGRKLLNRQEVEKTFEAFGFEIFHPEQHSFRDQALKVGQAAHLAGEFGSQMHNAVFADKTHQIVLQSESNPHVIQQRLGECLGHATTTIFGKARNSAATPHPRIAKIGVGDFSIDPAELEEALRSL